MSGGEAADEAVDAETAHGLVTEAEARERVAAQDEGDYTFFLKFPVFLKNFVKFSDFSPCFSKIISEIF